jgi:type I restriction enzyme S subunit
LVPESFETYQIVEPGDIIIRSTDLQNDKTSLRIGKVKNLGIITSAYMFLQPKISFNKDYAYLLLHGFDLMKVFYGMGSGLRQNLSWVDFKRMPIFLPSVDEQTQIARFLDHKSSQITRFIRDKKRMIELLKEQKQAIINDAVTGKIDVCTGNPYPKYKPSGVEWLGNIPNGWGTVPVKRIAYFNPSKTETGFNLQSDECVVFLPMENVSTKGAIDCSIRKPYREICSGFSYFKKGDVVVAKITPCFENGKGAFLETLETEYGFGTTEFITIRPSDKVKGKYLRLLLSSNWFLKIAEKYMTGSAGQKRIPTDFIKNFYIGLPSIDGQEKILECIQQEFRVLELAISRTECEITLMQEYRTRLIADVVTGKVDVRDIKVEDVTDEELLEDMSDAEEIPAYADLSAVSTAQAGALTGREELEGSLEDAK